MGDRSRYKVIRGMAGERHAPALGTPGPAFAQAVGEAKGTASIADGWNGFSWAIQSMAATYEELTSVSRDLQQRRGH